jgi:5-methylcytosine-specific restriction endonuclease McrA
MAILFIMGKIKNLSGMVFGELTAIKCLYINKNRKAVWLCKCSCGNFPEVTSIALSSGTTRSCGCLHKRLLSNMFFIDLAGKKFGRLTAIKKSDKVGKRGEIMWECVCDCGNTVTVLGRSIRDLKTISCGCYQSEIATRNHTIHGQSKTVEYRRAVANRRREKKIIFDAGWTGEMEHSLRKLFPFCVVCGQSNNLSTDHVYPLTFGNGLMPGNAVTLCSTCNSRKGKRAPDNLPKSLPSDAGDKILRAAQEFKEYWESLAVENSN